LETGIRALTPALTQHGIYDYLSGYLLPSGCLGSDIICRFIHLGLQLCSEDSQLSYKKDPGLLSETQPIKIAMVGDPDKLGAVQFLNTYRIEALQHLPASRGSLGTECWIWGWSESS
jgi:hypothetical protein